MEKNKCPACKGEGYIIQEISEYRTPNQETCETCHGTGQKDKLREIAKQIIFVTAEIDDGQVWGKDTNVGSADEIMNDVVALIEPLIEEAREQEYKQALRDVEQTLKGVQ